MEFNVTEAVKRLNEYYLGPGNPYINMTGKEWAQYDKVKDDIKITLEYLKRQEEAISFLRQRLGSSRGR